jgi:hypothetical protein
VKTDTVLNDVEEKIKEEIIRRAVEQADIREQEKQKLRRRKDILDALEEITELTHAELEEIEREVREAFSDHRKEFFSIRHQIFIVLLIGCALLGVFILLVRVS